MIKVSNAIHVYEVDGKDVAVDAPMLIVESHWNYNDRVTLCFGATRRTVLACELGAAIKNAQNVGRF